MDDRRRIGIIGGGASAVLLLANLAKYPQSLKFDIEVFDRNAMFARGIAYGTEYAAHRLNVRASGMSALADTPDDFAQWAGQRYTFAPDDFVPRGLFALYLDEKLKDALAQLSVKFIQDDVLSSQKTNDNLYAVKTANFYHAYDELVQATGNVRLIQPKVEDGVVNYFAEPWYLSTFKTIPLKGRVLLLGSGLSAVDAIGSLHAHGFEGEIIVVSRNGWFPSVHAVTAKYPAFIDETNLSLSPAAIMKRIRDELKKAKGEGIVWQAVIDSLRPTTNKTWQSWDDRQKAIFMRRAFTAWNIHRHRMSPETAAAAEQYRTAGKLKMVRDSAIKVAAPTRLVCKKQTIEADAIINCLGYRYDEGRQFEVSYKVGPPRFGDLFETTAIPEIRAQAGEVAAALAQK